MERDAVTEQSPEAQRDEPGEQGEVAGALAQIDAEIAELTAMLNRNRDDDSDTEDTGPISA